MGGLYWCAMRNFVLAGGGQFATEWNVQIVHDGGEEEVSGRKEAQDDQFKH